jgi:sugar phosphate isomerase/epimerase
MYGGVDARLLTVLTSPGSAARRAPGGTGFLCIENPDPAAAAVKRLLHDAGITPGQMVPWNACPWFTERERVSAADLEAGMEPWMQLMALLPVLRVIMLLGGAAQDGWKRLTARHPEMASRPGISLIYTYSPGPGALRHPDPQVREARRQDLRDAFRRAAAAIM